MGLPRNWACLVGVRGLIRLHASSKLQYHCVLSLMSSAFLVKRGLLIMFGCCPLVYSFLLVPGISSVREITAASFQISKASSIMSLS